MATHSEVAVLRQAMHQFSYAETFWRYSYMEARKVIADRNAEIRALKARVHELETIREDDESAVELDGVDHMPNDPPGDPLDAALDAELDDSQDDNSSDAYETLIDNITFRDDGESS